MNSDSLSLKRRRPNPDGGFRLHSRRSKLGIALVEVMVASALMIAVAVAVTHMLMVSTKIAASNRVLTAARAIVQRNLDNALAVRWDSTTTPSILAITSAAGSVYDDDGNGTGNGANGEGNNKVALLIEKKTDNSTYTVIPATLNRIVTAVVNTQNAPIRLVEFRLTYDFQGRTQTVRMSSMRAIDD